MAPSPWVSAGQTEPPPAVSHGCEPIGQPWTVTGVSGDGSSQSAAHWPRWCWTTFLQRTPNDLRNQTRTNLLVGLATDEYQAEFAHARGDFLVRSIAGIDQPSGAIAIGARARPGQTIQFQLRDAAIADLDLTFCLDGLRGSIGGLDPVAMVAFAGQERGRNLFGSESHAR